MPARRLEARERHRPGDDARRPRRHRPVLQPRRPVRREASPAAGPAAETRPLRPDPPQPGRGKDFGVAECRAVGLPQAAHSGAGRVASSRPAEARRRRAVARRGVPERPLHAVQVGGARLPGSAASRGSSGPNSDGTAPAAPPACRPPRRRGSAPRPPRSSIACGRPRATGPPQRLRRQDPPDSQPCPDGGAEQLSPDPWADPQSAVSGWRCPLSPASLAMALAPVHCLNARRRPVRPALARHAKWITEQNRRSQNLNYTHGRQPQAVARPRGRSAPRSPSGGTRAPACAPRAGSLPPAAGRRPCAGSGGCTSRRNGEASCRAAVSTRNRRHDLFARDAPEASTVASVAGTSR